MCSVCGALCKSPPATGPAPSARGPPPSRPRGASAGARDHDRYRPADGVANRRVLLRVGEQLVELFVGAIGRDCHADADPLVTGRDRLVEPKQPTGGLVTNAAPFMQ